MKKLNSEIFATIAAGSVLAITTPEAAAILDCAFAHPITEGEEVRHLGLSVGDTLAVSSRGEDGDFFLFPRTVSGTTYTYTNRLDSLEWDGFAFMFGLICPIVAVTPEAINEKDSDKCAAGVYFAILESKDMDDETEERYTVFSGLELVKGESTLPAEAE